MSNTRSKDASARSTLRRIEELLGARDIQEGLQQLYGQEAEEREERIRENLGRAIEVLSSRKTVSSLSGVSEGTVRAFLNGSADSSLRNVIAMGAALKLSLGDMEMDSTAFGKLLRSMTDGSK